MKSLKIGSFVLSTVFAVYAGSLPFQTAALLAANPASDTHVPDKSINQLSFLHGKWTSEKNGSYVEEYWSRVEGDGLIGHCRFVKDGKTTFYELLAIVKRPEDIVLRMKHLNGDFVAWSDKEEAGDCKLTHLGNNEATFDNGNSQHRVKVTYRKKDASTMHVEVEDTQDGKTSTHPFEYTLAD